MDYTSISRLKTIIVASLILALGARPAIAQNSTPDFLSEFQSFIKKAVSDSYKSPYTIGLGTFTYADTALPSDFSRRLAEEFSVEIPKTKGASVLSKNLAAAMDPQLKTQYEDFIKTAKPDCLLHGTFNEERGWVRVYLELTDLATLQVLNAVELRRPMSSISDSIAIRPSVQAQTQASQLSTIYTSTGPEKVTSGKEKGSTQEAARLKVSVATDRGAGGTYAEGEDLVVMMGVNKDAYIKIYHIDVNGSTQLIYPNRFDPGRKLAAGSVVRIPGPGYGFTFRLGKPFGTEFIKVVASTVPFSISESSFSALGNNAVSVITPGASVSASYGGNAEFAESLASYYIGPR